MATATITTTILSGVLLSAGIANALRDAFLSIGFTTFDSYLASNVEHRIMSYQFSNSTKGTAYLQISIAAGGGITYQLFDGWNTTTKAGTNGTGSQAIATLVSGNNAITFHSVSHPEFRGVVVEQTTTQGVIGLLRPKATVPTWWNENSYLYCFLTKYNSTSGSSRFSATTTPFGVVTDHEYLQSAKMQDGNNQNSNARSMFPLIILSNAVGGLINSCDDVVVCASNTLRPLDTLTVSGSEIYTYCWGNNQTNGIAIRTT